MNFTADWFTHNIGNFEYCRGLIQPINRILEVGCYEGRATCWMLQNMLSQDGVISIIDSFEGGEEHHGIDMAAVKERFYANAREARGENQHFYLMSGTSSTSLSVLGACKVGVLGFEGLTYSDFDFIYIDGSHKAPDVLSDMVLAWKLLRVGGIMLCDDYLWGEREGYPIFKRPKVAIDAFWAIHTPEARIVISNQQMAFMKMDNGADVCIPVPTQC